MCMRSLGWGKIVSSVSNALDFNQATLSGCIDIICIESEIESKLKGENKISVTYKSTPFHVRFGKTKLLRSKEKIVSILVNGKSTNLHMKLGSAGEAYFVEKTYDDVEEELETSPLSSPRHEYNDLYLDQHIDSCSINDSLNNFKSDDDSDKSFLRNIAIDRRKSVDRNYKLEQGKGRKQSNSQAKGGDLVARDQHDQQDGRDGLDGLDGLAHNHHHHRPSAQKDNLKKKKKNKSPHLHRNLLGEDYGHHASKRKTDDDDPNANSEWSWSWGRLPHLKNQDYASDNCTAISSNNKNEKKEKKKKFYNKSESVHDHSSSREQLTCVRRRNLSESNVRKCLDKERETKNFPRGSKTKHVKRYRDSHLDHVKKETPRKLSNKNDADDSRQGPRKDSRGSHSAKAAVKAPNPLHQGGANNSGSGNNNGSANNNGNAHIASGRNGGNSAHVEKRRPSEGEGLPSRGHAADAKRHSERGGQRESQRSSQRGGQRGSQRGSQLGSQLGSQRGSDANRDPTKGEPKKEAEETHNAESKQEGKQDRDDREKAEPRGEEHSFGEAVSEKELEKGKQRMIEKLKQKARERAREKVDGGGARTGAGKEADKEVGREAGKDAGRADKWAKAEERAKARGKLKAHHEQHSDEDAAADAEADAEMNSNEEDNQMSYSKDEPESTFDDDIQNRIECSLCGHLLLNQNADNEQSDYNIEIHNKNIFEANIVTYDQIDKNSNLWYHPSLVFRFDKKDPYYPSRVALPLLASWVVFNQPLSILAVEKLLNSSLTLVEIKDKGWRNWFGVSSVEYDNNTINTKSTGKDPKGSHQIEDKKKEGRKSATKMATTAGGTTTTSSNNNNHYNNGNGDNHEAIEMAALKEHDAKRSVQHSLHNPSEVSRRSTKHGEEKIKIRYRKSLRPTSEQLQSLNLKEGANTITFLVTSSLQGTKSINGTIYLWKKNAKIVISDVDGTITRSNVLGHIMPIVGKDWSHVGVSQLFNKINNNGYHILYLTARAIGQADSTREYLFRFKRNDNNKLPDGPLILSPDRLFPSFKREVIDKKPYIFKIAALRDIRNLFPLNHNPFYAAFGNTESDHRAYISVGVPEAKVFIIDNRGIVHHVNSTYAKTYETMSEITEHMFPCIKNDKKREDDDQYNSFQYWKINSLTYYEKYMNVSDSS
ncbi:hypothetical protein, conserved [Plasmodium vivax]|uniref:phosphatidate phosphatase n=1 Tax=Plasmodium vivax (strain Salvador I) TaxID=126793 RepID=A5KB49_PLAVS|nr:hypothetical protein, conserved [Plasmodium vivax]EDL43327.1 hypothetical protein, conserved [Plasmodium vivax]|eukprot:XP_001613054.1 hypothetical protein [Plasmodium vivax Sal-1]